MVKGTMKRQSSTFPWRLWIWAFVVVGVSVVAEEKSQTYDLPSFSLVLNVKKAETALIDFQDRLNFAVRLHLVEFFKQRVGIPSYGDGDVEALELISSYVWKEQSKDSSNGLIEYEVRSNFDCQLQVDYSSETEDESQPSPSIMNLLLIEAFQGENYWNLVHSLLTDVVLEDITSMTVTVLTEAYVHNNGEGLLASYDRESMEKEDDWTPAMTTGIIVAGLLVFVLVLIWTYLCCFTRGALVQELCKLGRKQKMEKADSVTDDLRSTSSLDPERESEIEGQWMDAWAQAVTSIPLREPVKTRKSKKRAAIIRHPAQQHNSYLNCIEEADDECSTVCSSTTTQSHASNSAGKSSTVTHEIRKKDDEVRQNPLVSHSRSNLQSKRDSFLLSRIEETV